MPDAKRKSGFGPLPVSLKIIFILTILGLLLSLLSLVNFSQMPPSGVVFGMWFSQDVVILNLLIFSLALPALFAFGIFKRKEWAWKLGLLLYAIGIISSVLAFPMAEQVLRVSLEQAAASNPQLTPAVIEQAMGLQLVITQAAMIAGIILTLVFAFFVWKHRNYFED